MKHKRLLSWILIFALLFETFNVPVYAEGNSTTISGDGTAAQTAQMTITLKIKETPVAGDFSFTPPSSLTYDGQPKTATVTSSREGMGAITLDYYSGDTKLDGAPTAEGIYTVKVNVAEGSEYKAATGITGASWTFTIVPYSMDMTITLNIPAAAVTTAPIAKTGLKCKGSAQALVTAGTAANGTMEYAIGDNGINAPTEGWSSELPTGTEVGTYHVWYRATSSHGNTDARYLSAVEIASDTYAMTITLTIIDKDPAVVTKAPTAKSLTYNGSAQALVTAGTASGGTMQYALGANATTAPTTGWSTSIPAKTDAGTYYVWYKVDPDDNHNGIEAVCVTVTISKVDQTIAVSVLPEQTEASYAVTVAMPAGDGCWRYEYVLTEGEESTFPDSPLWRPLPAVQDGQFYPDGLDAGKTYKIWLRLKGDTNHNASEPISKTFTTPAKVMLSYDANGGSGILPEAKLYDAGSTTDQIDEGKGISRYGYSFQVWTTVKNGTGTPYNGGADGFQINSSTVLYAQWTQNIYTVKFDPNGGTETMANQAFTFDASATALANNNFMKEGSTFAGWALKPDGEVVYKNGQAVRNLAPSGTVTLYAVWIENTYSITGIVKNETDNNPVSGVKVKLVRGGEDYGTEQQTGGDGSYSFTGVPAGIYNIIAEKGTSGNEDHRKMTALVEIKSDKRVDDITLPEARVNSVVQVEANTPAVMVGELDEVAKDEKEEGKEVTVTMTVQTKDESNAEGAAEIKALAETDSATGADVELDYLDIEIKKAVSDGISTINETIIETDHVIEMIVPFNFANRKNCELFRYHDGIAQKFNALNARPTAYLQDATFYADRANSRMYVYGSRFSTYAISYETADKVMVTFRKNDGTEVQETQEIELGTETALTANGFTRSGYSFVKWNTEANGQGTDYSDGQRVTLENDLVLYAQWRQNYVPPTPTYYTVRFEMNGHGAAITSQSIKSGGKVTKPADPTADDYVFGGWFTDVDCTKTYDFTKSVYSSFTLYAKWVKDDVKYTVSFNMMNHGESIEPQTVSAGQTLTKPEPDPAAEGYDFGGWFTEAECENEYDFTTPVTGNFWLYAKWTVKTYTVSFNMSGKTAADAPETQTVEHGKTAVRPEKDPETEGFLFINWYTEAACENVYDFTTPVTGNVELFAGWREAKKFSVSFNMNGKMATDVPETQQVEEGKCAVEPAVSPKAEGFRFAGWYKEAECENHFDFNSPVMADTEVYAKWVAEDVVTFTVTFDLNGKPGTAPSAQTVEKDKTATEPGIPVAEGFTFTGWYKEAACKTKYDFATPVTADITLYAGWESGEPVVIEEGADWNLYEDASVHEFKVRGINVNGTVANSNAKSKAYYDAKISGSTITVSVTGNRKKAASNAVLEFNLGNAGTVVYVLPVSYVKPSFKLSSTSGSIKSGTETVLKTTLLVKNADGSFEPYDMTDVKVSGTGLGTVTKAEDGSIEIRTSAAGKGKISIVKDAWDDASPVSLAYTVKSYGKDVLNVDLGGLKSVVVNSNAKEQKFSFDMSLNGTVPAEGAVTIVDKKNTGLASISEDGKLVIAYKDGVKNGTYTITLQAGEAKTNVKIKVTDKSLEKAVTAKIKTKYDVVTRQSMVVVPKLKDISGTIVDVSVAEKDFTAKLNAAGNIVIDYTGTVYNAKNLNIGTLTLSLSISGIEEPVKLTLNKVKAKKTTPKVKVGTVTIPAGAATADGKVIGTANIVSSYKVSSGMYKTIKPVKVEIVGTPKNVTAKVNESDMTEIDIYSISKKNVSFKVKLTYAGGVTKTVTVKVKRK